MFLLLLALPVFTLSHATPQRIVPAEWRSTLTGTVNSTVVFQGTAFKSAAQQSVLLRNGTSNQPSSTSTLWRNDLLSIFHVAPSASIKTPTSCTRTQLYESELLLLLDFLLAPGTVHQGVTTINNRQCDVWVSPFAKDTPWGKFVCLETSISLAYQRPVRFWLKLPALDFVVDFEEDFKAAGNIPSSVFAVPTNCPTQPAPATPQPLPIGLSDSFDQDQVASFWMPPLKKYYTYEPGHITLSRNGTTGTRAARVSVQPGDVRNGNTERDELDLPMLRLGGRELYYSWRFMLGEDFGVSRNRIVIGQWKQSALFTQSPVISLRVKEQRLVLGVRNLTLGLSDNDRLEFTLEEVLDVGEWYDVKFGIMFSHGRDGFVKVWVNGREAATFLGPTMSTADEGYFDFHFGVYRNVWNVTQTLLLDGFVVSGNESGGHG